MERLRVAGAQALSLAALVAAWEGAVRIGLADPLFVPAPSAVLQALAAIGPEALRLFWETLAKTLLAYGLAIGIGVGLGLVIGSLRHLYEVVNPYLVAAYAIPKILLLPWIVLIFGIGVTPAVVYATIHGVFPIALLVIGGVQDVDRTPILVARSMGATTWQVYRKVILPAVLPSVLAGMRLGIIFCLLGVLLVEMFAGVRGMGHLLGGLANAFQAAELFAATALVSALSIGIVVGLEVLNRRLGRWRG